MFAGYDPADHRLAPLIRRVMDEYPDDSLDLFYEEVLNPFSMGYRALVAVTEDGRLTQTTDAPALATLRETLGPSLDETSLPDDDRPLYGGP